MGTLTLSASVGRLARLHWTNLERLSAGKSELAHSLSCFCPFFVGEYSLANFSMNCTIVRPDDDESHSQPRITALFGQSGTGTADLAQQRKQYSTFASNAAPRPRPQLLQDMALKNVIDF